MVTGQHFASFDAGIGTGAIVILTIQWRTCCRCLSVLNYKIVYYSCKATDGSGLLHLV